MRPFKTADSRNTSDSRTYRLLTYDRDPFPDEGVFYYKSKGITKWKTKRLTRRQVRMYRTWKHNRRLKFKSL